MNILFTGSWAGKINMSLEFLTDWELSSSSLLLWLFGLCFLELVKSECAKLIAS